ncbi:AAA domain-containing protein [Listeria cornellensis]|uniref:AAA domain-containing protein n=1 Tax=Listeria cornellensis TaxID=1494961 RepID=UPI0004AE8C66|nr:AAA domain-containing protein [Listeria cornellensis]
MSNIDFLWARQGDKEKFEFEYTNMQGNRKTHKPNGIQHIDEAEGKVRLLFNTRSFEYVIDRMESLHLRNSEAFLKTISVEKEVKYENKSYTSNNIYSYYNEIIDYLIGGNIKNNPKDADGLNFSMQSTKEKILSSDAHKFNKAIFKKFMNGNKAERIILNQESKPLVLPFISNQSQKKAVTNALEYDISVIQGPPGTGKTQTILNIICNAIVEDKKSACGIK